MSDATWDELVFHARHRPRRQWASTGDGEEAVLNPAHAGRPDPTLPLLRGGGGGFTLGVLVGTLLVHAGGAPTAVGALAVALGVLVGLGASWRSHSRLKAARRAWEASRPQSNDPHMHLGKVWPHDLGEDGSALLGLFDQRVKETKKARKHMPSVVAGLDDVQGVVRWNVAVCLFFLAQDEYTSSFSYRQQDKLVRTFELLSHVCSGAQDESGALGTIDRLYEVAASSTDTTTA